MNQYLSAKSFVFLAVLLGSCTNKEPPTTVTKVIGANGGTIVSGDGQISLFVSDRALAADTSISLTTVAEPPAGALTVGAQIAPGDLGFTEPAILTFNYQEQMLKAGQAPTGLRIIMYVQGVWKIPSLAAVDTTKKTVSAAIKHLGNYFLAYAPACTQNSDCYSPARCVSGYCDIPCKTNDDCEKPLSCQNNRCLSQSCGTQEQCINGGGCFKGICVIGCPGAASSRCPAGQICTFGGSCIFNECDLAGECASSSSLSCAYGLCLAKMGCTCGDAQCPCVEN